MPLCDKSQKGRNFPSNLKAKHCVSSSVNWEIICLLDNPQIDLLSNKL